MIDLFSAVHSKGQVTHRLHFILQLNGSVSTFIEQWHAS